MVINEVNKNDSLNNWFVTWLPTYSNYHTDIIYKSKIKNWLRNSLLRTPYSYQLVYIRNKICQPK